MDLWIRLRKSGKFGTDRVSDAPILRQLIRDSLGAGKGSYFTENEYDAVLMEAGKHDIWLCQREAKPLLPICSICGEESGSTGSLKGHVHKWGPVDHPFTPSS